MYKYLYVTIITRFVFLESSSKYDRCKRVISEIPKNKVTGYLSPVVHELISYAKSVQCVDKYSSSMLNLLYQHFRGADDCSVANNVLQSFTAINPFLKQQASRKRRGRYVVRQKMIGEQWRAFENLPYVRSARARGWQYYHGSLMM